MELYVDDRERAVITHIENVHVDDIKYKVKRMTVGDYAIIYRDYIMIIIERKTWADLASSLRDGRASNINKLLKTRETTGCQLVYLIEGNPCPRPSQLYARMPVKNLRAHLDHIAFRDGIHLVYTLNQAGTAQRLFELAKNLASIRPSMLKEIDDIISEKANTDETKLETDETDETNLLTAKQESSVSVQEQLLQCLPSVGSVVATVMAEAGITLLSLYNVIVPESLARYKYPTGNSIGLSKARRICGNRKHMIDTTIASKKVQVRILSAIPLIRKNTAEVILQTVSFSSIMDGAIDIEALKNIQRGKTKLGKKAASNIISSLLNQ